MSRPRMQVNLNLITSFKDLRTELYIGQVLIKRWVQFLRWDSLSNRASSDRVGVFLDGRTFARRAVHTATPQIGRGRGQTNDCLFGERS